MSKILNSFIYSVSGIGELLKTRSFIYELILFCFWLFYVVFRGFSSFDVTTIILFAALFSIEALNTCIELICDKIDMSFCNITKAVKDIASSAVFFIFLALIIHIIYYEIYI